MNVQQIKKITTTQKLESTIHKFVTNIHKACEETIPLIKNKNKINLPCGPTSSSP